MNNKTERNRNNLIRYFILNKLVLFFNFFIYFNYCFVEMFIYNMIYFYLMLQSEDYLEFPFVILSVISCIVVYK